MKKVLKAIAMLFVVAAIVFAAGCAGKTGNMKNEAQENETQGNNDQLQPVNPEIPANVTNNTTETNEIIEKGQVVTEADSGKTISLKKGENFTVILREDPSAGYLWKLNLSNGLSILNDEYIEGLNPEHLEGVPGTHLWIIEATAPGSQKVNGIYRRSWENITGTEKKFTLNLEVE